MTDIIENEKYRYRIPLVGAMLLFFWTVTIVVFLIWEIRGHHHTVIELATIEAKTHLDKDLVYRRWSAGHGGTYVPITDESPSNPYLSNVDERDITTPSGKRLTLINPAYMTRQVHELGITQYGAKGHITSLKPIRPENFPDQWEAEALQSFENGKKESKTISFINQIEYMRYMIPLATETRCLKCHAHQGYKEGDVRGGISVAIPLKKYRAIQSQYKSESVLYLGIIYAVGAVILIVSFAAIYKREQMLKISDMALRKSNLALKENESFLNKILDTIPIGVWFTDKEGHIIYGNPAGQKIWQGVRYIDPSQLQEYKAWWIDSGKRITPEEWGVTRAIRHQEESHEERIEIECFDGTHKYILNWAVPIMSENGTVEGAIALNQDITDQIKAENSLKENVQLTHAIMKGIPDAIFVKDRDLKHLFVNDACAGIIGMPVKDIIGKNNQELFPPEIAAELDTFDRNILLTGETTKHEENIITEGENRIFEIVKGPYKDTNDNVIGLFGIARDLTDRVAFEKEKEKMKEHILQAQKMEAVGTLAGGIAHDFNNLLSVIIGNISYALSLSDKNVEMNDVLNDVKEGARQAQNLTHQLLTFAKGGEPIKKPKKINSLIQESARFVTSGAKSRCDFKLADDLWTAEIDSGQIHQVISNLVINADQAMPNGGTIYILTENVEIFSDSSMPLSPGRYVKITVEDMGIGIDSKHLACIFDPYFTTKQKGSGLGLATTYSIIKRHGGHIAVYSESGKGTIFNVFLPASSKSLEITIDSDQAEHKGQGRVLIMDDQEQILKMVGRMLDKMGYVPEFAANGTIAIELYSKAFETKNPYAFVILDLTVPAGMGGVETVSELMKIDPKIKAVVSSGYSNDPIMANYQDYGFCGVVPKPFTKEHLAKLLVSIFPKK